MQSLLISNILKINEKIYAVLDNFPVENYDIATLKTSELSLMPEKPFFTFSKKYVHLKKFIFDNIGPIYFFDLETIKDIITLIVKKIKLEDPFNSDIIYCNESLQSIFKRKIIYLPELFKNVEKYFLKLPNTFQIMFKQQNKNHNKLFFHLLLRHQIMPSHSIKNIAKNDKEHKFQTKTVSLNLIDNQTIFWTPSFENNENILNNPTSLYFLKKQLSDILQTLNSFRNRNVFTLNDIYNYFWIFVNENQLVSENIINLSTNPLRNLFKIPIFHRYQIPLVLQPFVELAGIPVTRDSIMNIILTHVPIVKFEKNTQ